MTMCVQEKGRLLMEQVKSAFLTSQGNNKDRANDKGKGKVPTQADSKKKESKCFFYKKKGHIKKDCVKFK